MQQQSVAQVPCPSLVPVLLTASLLLLVWTLVSQESPRPLVVIQVADQSVQRLEKLVHQQQLQLDRLARHPKVVYRCLADEPRIWYPKRASDDLTHIAMTTADGCGDNSRLDALFLVHTSANHFKRRKLFRAAYTNTSETYPYLVKVVFLIGHVHDAKLQIDLEVENRDFGDTVVGSFYDSYENLTLKAVMGYRWLTANCRNLPLLVKLDDDVLVDVPKFFQSYRRDINPLNKPRSIFCNVWERAKVQRTGKWKIERSLFRNESYAFPYCSGYLVVVTADLVPSMYLAGKSIDFFWVDDVFLYGMVPHNITGVTFTNLGDYYDGKRVITEVHKRYDLCLKKKGAGCEKWAVLTKNEADFEKLFFRMKQAYLRNNTRNENNPRP